MPLWLRSRTIWIVLVLVFLPLACGLLFLGQNAKRGWSLHWVTPTRIVKAVSNNAPETFAATTSRSGWDVLWARPRQGLSLSRFHSDGKRAAPDVLLSGTPQTLALAHVGSTDVAAWRQDTSNGSDLRAAVIGAGGRVRYLTLASGVWPLEHPSAFADGSHVDIVFSWQRSAFDVYMARISVGGRATSPIRLTHSKTYAFLPHAQMDGDGSLRLLYLDQCCGSAGLNVVTRRFTVTGKPLSGPQVLDTILSVSSNGQGQAGSGVPDKWGIDLERVGNQIWAAWSDDQGLAVAAWQKSRLVVPSHPFLAGIPSPVLTVSATPEHRNVIWQQQTSLGQHLYTVQLAPDGSPASFPDRIDFQAADAGLPRAVVEDGQPAVIWESAPTKGTGTQLEVSRFSSAQIGPPSIWARFGLGLANPLGNLVLLLFGALAVGALIAAGNILLAIVLIILYFILNRLVRGRWRWYAYSGVLAVALYIVFVQMGAPFPPVLFLSSLSVSAGLVAVGGMLIFVLLLALTAFRRIDDVFRAAAMAFAGIFFIAFLQALTIVQDQLGRI